jgi:CheY-like chemotaxis protein
VAERRITGYSGNRRRILTADDDPDHLELLNDILAPLGFVMFSARDGQSCLAVAEDCAPDLVILDIAMPGRSGLEVAAVLRARFGEKIRILIVSGNFFDAPKLQAMESRDKAYDAFLAKPTDIRALLEAVGSLLALKWLHDEPLRAVHVPDNPHDMVRPAARHLSDLLQLGQIGYVRGIEAKLTEITEVEPETAAFTAYLRDLVRRFELARYMACLEEFLALEP